MNAHIFMTEMLNSQKDGELNSFVLNNWNEFLEKKLKGDFEKMDAIIEVARFCIENPEDESYELMTEDVMNDDIKSIFYYEEKINSKNDPDLDIKKLRLEIEKNALENEELKESIARSEAMVMEALDMMLY